MFKYSIYAGNAEPAAFALRKAGHYFTANLLSLVAIIGIFSALIGIFSALIGILLASSRLIYSFGRDGLLSPKLGKINTKHVPKNALWSISLGALILASFFPFDFLATLVSAGTLVAFIFVSIGIYALRKREGIDLPEAKFKMPGYPLLPAISALVSIIIFWNLNIDAKLLMLVWFIIGIIIYFVYGMHHSNLNKK